MTDSAQPAPRPAWRHPAVRLAGSAVILTLLFTFLPADQLISAIRRLSPVMIGLAVVSYMLLHLIGVSKWRLLVNTTGADLGFVDGVRAYYSGLFGNTFLPSIVGGDLVRAGVAFGAVRSRSGLLLGSMVDRVQDVVGLGLLAGIGALLSPLALTTESRRVFLLLAFLLAAGAASSLAIWRLFPVHRSPWRVRRKLVSVRRAVRATAGRPANLVGAGLLGMLLQSLLIVLNWRLGIAIGIDIPLYVWFFVWPLAKIAGLLPVTQGGIGVREAAQAALFAPFGVPAVAAVATGLAFEVVIILGGLAGGGVAWLLALLTRSRDVPDRSPRDDGGAASTDASSAVRVGRL
ncbi:MAG TPA: lysylphosphatidylglycerol synthase transmembrane domain-containing protein [Gemmatimonadaceae bacterium]